MSEIVEIIDILETRLKKVLHKTALLEEKNKELNLELQKFQAIYKNQELKTENLLKEIETLKIAKSLLGSEDNKRDTKLKINSLIKEIDSCIAQLAD